ncbi:outer membrane protein TolC [Deinococcus metalli]|uniref:Outer membrane protein TolC n=1 Tax=Deinococcus metalli TaxID=1141878 RepID=A0A7W8KCH9_9DEIO|nr:TolC family protein [Deinococcus metalli]MBB5375662.1 outer membrane protein TolC [Deinococcus metalli]GHF37981.1 transporter [Deinococcus metalli]
MMSRTRSLTALTAALLVPAAHAQSAAPVSLTAAVTAALANNTDVKTAQANLDKAQAANQAAQADPSSLVAAKLSAKNTATLAQAQLRGAKLGALQNTVTAYTALLEAQENVTLQTLQVQVDTKNVQVAQVKLGIGNATQLDVTNAQNTLASSQQNLADGKAQVNLASARLATLTGLGSGVRAAGAPTVPKLTSTQATLQGGLGNLSAVTSAAGDLALAQLNVKLADNDFTPARTLQDAKTALANAQRSADSASKTATQSLASAYQAAQNAYELLAVAQSREAAAQKTATQDAARLKSGTISAVELQNTQLALKKAQYARLQAQDNVLTALASLSVAAGVNLTGIGGSI